MLTILDIVNRLLNAFNIQDKPKGRAFTLVAFFANFYLLYVALNNLRFADYRLMGLLFLVLFLLAFYFIFLNYLYYFTDKKFKYDVSPRIERALGGSAKMHAAAEKAYTADAGVGNGIFADDQVLPAQITIDSNHQLAIDNLVKSLQEQGAITLDYHGLDDGALQRIVTKTMAPVLAMGAPMSLPFCELRHTMDNRWVLFGGLNSFDATELAEVTGIGITPIETAAEQYQLASAQVVLTGGPQKQPGRSGLNEITTPFAIEAQLAYVETNKM